MKKIIILCICLLSFNSCNAQKTNKKNNNNKTTLTKNKMNQYQYLINKSIEKINLSRGNYTETRPNGNFTKVITGKYGSFYQEFIKNDYYKIDKAYYLDGNIQSKGISFNQDTFRVGIWYEFDKNGKLIKETNYDDGYDFTLEDVIRYAETQKDIRRYEHIENVIFPKGEYVILNRGQYNTIKKDNLDNRKLWIIEYNISDKEENILRDGKIIGREYILTYTQIVLDGRTGKLLYKKVIGIDENNPEAYKKIIQEAKSTSSIASPEEKNTFVKSELGTSYTSQSELTANKNIYQVYEGRYYTKAEWEAFQKTLPWWKRIL